MNVTDEIIRRLLNKKLRLSIPLINRGKNYHANYVENVMGI